MAKKENNKKAVRTDKDKKVSKLNRAIYSAIDPTYGYPTGLAIPAAGIKAGISLFSPDDMTYEVTDSVADAAWRKRLGLSYDDKFIIPNKDGSYRLPKNVEREIPIDTTFLKKRIANNEKLLKGKSVKGKAYTLIKNMNKLDKETLEALRKTYKTGEPVVVSEYSHNNRQLIKDGELIKGAETYISPLNVLQNYTIQYNPKNNSMLYRDVYDFNGYESFVPGESFNIEGEIPLNRKYFIGGLLGGLGTANTNATNSFMNSGLGKGLSGLGVKAGGLGGIANSAATAIGGLLAGKNKTGVGSAMQTVGSLASNIPGVGGIIGAGVNLLGGVVNAAFGSSINKEFVNQTEQAARQQSEYTSGASTNEQLLSDYSGLSFMGDVSKKDVGSDGWFSNKASKKTRALNEAIDNANFRALTSLGNTAENIDKQNDLSLMANYSAYGGPMNMKYSGAMSPFGNQFADGGIYIKPSHRGRLTKLKERTGKTEAELYNDGNPAHKKMVVFARNARKWKHADGGPLDGQSELDLLEARSNKARALIGKPNEFFDTWNEARLQTGRFNDQLGEGILERQKQRRDSAPIFNNLNAFADISYIRGTTPGLLNEETPREAANRYNKNKSKYAQSTVDKLRDKAQGAYWESPNTIYVDPKYPEALIHEQAHASHAKEQEDKIEEILGNSDMYKDRKGEIYSRLMQFREKNNLNPNTVWDKESLKELKKNAVDFSILNRYNDDEVLRLLNEVADAGNIDNFISKNNKVNYAAKGGQLFTNGVTTIGNGGTHEQNPFEGVQIGVDPEGIPNLVEEGEVIYNDYVYSNRLKPSEELKKKYKIRGITFADAAKQIQKESEERPNDPIAKDTLKAIMLDLQNEQDMVRSKNNNNKHAEGGRLAHKYSGEETDSQVMARAKAKRQGLNVGSSLDDYLKNPIYEDTESTIAPIKDSILRYAPAIGSGLAVISDWFGGNEPNYTNADLFQRAIEGSKRDITFKPVGNYLRYNPLDRDYYTNKLSANAAASRRGAINTSGGNRAAALAGLLASDYNYGNQLGDLARQAEEYNLAQRQRVEEFNRGTNTTNAEMSLRSQMANAEQSTDRARMYASLAGMRQELLDRNRAEKSSNLTNFLQNLGNIGRETVDKDMLRWLADKGALRGIRACGGKIRRKKRGGFTV